MFGKRKRIAQWLLAEEKFFHEGYRNYLWDELQKFTHRTTSLLDELATVTWLHEELRHKLSKYEATAGSVRDYFLQELSNLERADQRGLFRAYVDHETFQALRRELSSLAHSFTPPDGSRPPHYFGVEVYVAPYVKGGLVVVPREG